MKKLLKVTAALSLGVSLAACEKQAETQETVVPESTTVTMQVTGIEDTVITGDLGTLESGQMMGNGMEKPDGEPPEMPENGSAESAQKPEGEAPEMAGNGSSEGGEKPEGEAPEMPENSSAEGAQKPEGEAPEMPNGEGQGMPGGNGMSFVASGENLSITVTDNTTITVEFLQGESEGTLSDIAVGSVLTVTYSGDEAETIVVCNLNRGNGFGGSDTVDNGTSVETIDSDCTKVGMNYSSSGDDENALRVSGATVELSNITVEKTGGESSNTENGDFYGANAGLLALDGANVTITDSEITTNAVNGNGVFSYGEGTTVTISDSKIRTSQRNSGGIQTTGGGTTIANNLDVETDGDSSAAIRSDRGGGTVVVNGGAYVTNGLGSPAVYCTADITVNDAILTANASESVVVEGKNSVTLNRCTLVGTMNGTHEEENVHGIMIYQSMSGDADIGEAFFRASDSVLETTVGDLFYVTNTTCTLELENTDLVLADGNLLTISGNTSSRGWGTQGANGGKVEMQTTNQKLIGVISVDSISSLNLTADKTEFVGAINPDNEGGTVNLTMTDSTWTLTSDSYVTSFEGDLDQVDCGSYHLYVNGQLAK